jgi:plastocyanin
VATGGGPQDTAAGSAPRKSPAAKAGGADCTKATKVAIVEKASGDAFSPTGLTIQRGAFLAVTNKTGTVHPLSAPDAGIVTSVIDLKERQVIQFPEAGKFTVRTGDAVLRLTVAGESGCGSPEPALTITGAGEFTPAKATVTATENFAVVNRSDVTHTVSCTPGSNKDHTRLHAGETQILALDEPGRYVCASVQHPAATVTITVTAAAPSR